MIDYNRYYYYAGCISFFILGLIAVHMESIIILIGGAIGVFIGEVVKR